MPEYLISNFDVGLERGNAFLGRFISSYLISFKRKFGDIMQKKRIDLVGKRYGMLVVEKYVETKNRKAYWLCKCDCGNTKELPSAYLMYGDTRSCGCRYDAINETGNKYGKLTVIERVSNIGYRGAKWLCSCDCGNTTKVTGGTLRNGARKSCGCLHEVNIEKTGAKILYANTKLKCKHMKREFTLTLDQFSKFLKGNCVYCNSPPLQILKRQKSKKIQLIYNGIDRVDSSVGYIPDNCVACCKKCNRSKSDLPLEEWKEHLLKIVKFMRIQ